MELKIAFLNVLGTDCATVKSYPINNENNVAEIQEIPGMLKWNKMEIKYVINKTNIPITNVFPIFEKKSACKIPRIHIQAVRIIVIINAKITICGL